MKNIHSRTLDHPIGKVSAQLATLATDHDSVWPNDRWPAMRLNKGLAVGSSGGHGFVRYSVESVNPNTVVFRFHPSVGLDGTHRFTVTAGTGAPASTVLSHIIDAEPRGLMRLVWPLVVAPLHNALVEDAFDSIAAALRNQAVVRQNLSRRVRLTQAAMRRVMSTVRTSNRHRIALLAASALGATAALHVMWGLGVTWPADTPRELARLVAGTNQFPSTAACLVVAGALLAAAAAVLQVQAEKPRIARPLAVVVALGVSAALLLRGVGGFLVSGLTQTTAGMPFRAADLLLYSPFCVLLGVAVLSTTSSRD
jgi:hypothetical protein